jgi:hypothetical protein
MVSHRGIAFGGGIVQRSNTSIERSGSEFGFGFLAVVAVVLIGAALRLVPHPSNFSPIGAMALFGGAHLARRSRLSQVLAFVLPLAAMLLSDAVLGFHNQMVAVYGSFLLVTALGYGLRAKPAAGRVALASVAGSLIFFVITNFSMWAEGGWYERSAKGLATCYIAAVPFLQNSLAGDLFFTAVLFGGYALAQKLVPRLAQA